MEAFKAHLECDERSLEIRFKGKESYWIQLLWAIARKLFLAQTKTKTFSVTLPLGHRRRQRFKMFLVPKFRCKSRLSRWSRLMKICLERSQWSLRQSLGLFHCHRTMLRWTRTRVCITEATGTWSARNPHLWRWSTSCNASTAYTNSA